MCPLFDRLFLLGVVTPLTFLEFTVSLPLYILHALDFITFRTKLSPLIPHELLFFLRSSWRVGSACQPDIKPYPPCNVA